MTQAQDTRRITLVSRDPRGPQRDWDHSPFAASRLIIVDSFTVLRYAVANNLSDMDVDVDRIVLDQSSSASEYLALLASLPHEFRGDVLLIREDDGGFLSATGRGGDRVLYAVSPADLRFYLETHGLVRGKHAHLSVTQSSEGEAAPQQLRRIRVA